MATFYNQMEVEEIVAAVRRRAPELAPYADALERWVEIVNSNSDGWHSWKGGYAAAGKILELFKGARFGIWDKPTAAEAARAFSGIKSAATRHKLPAPVVPAAPKQGGRSR